MGRLKKFVTLILALVWIVIVAILFKTISDPRIAGVIAGLGFFSLPLFIFRQQKQAPCVCRILTLQFWILFAVPILFSRLLFWEQDFKSFTFFGVFTGDQWHKFSTSSYSLMLLGLVLQLFLEMKSAKKLPKSL